MLRLNMINQIPLVTLNQDKAMSFHYLLSRNYTRCYEDKKTK